jgi:nucleotide-binding universal stress UspA family protein
MPLTMIQDDRTTPAPSDTPLIVVGYDGSDEARLAVSVAADRAGPGGTIVPLLAVPAAPGWLGAPYYERQVESSRRVADDMLAEIEGIETGDAAVAPELMEGEPAEALMRVARQRGAKEIVVGSRGLGRFRSIFGSVSHALLELADRPVVIVPRGAVDVDH